VVLKHLVPRRRSPRKYDAPRCQELTRSLQIVAPEIVGYVGAATLGTLAMRLRLVRKKSGALLAGAHDASDFVLQCRRPIGCTRPCRSSSRCRCGRCGGGFLDEWESGCRS
jgi:hypothetical protein